MTTRRITPREKNSLEQYDQDGISTTLPEKSNITPAVPAAVIYKLLSFTLAMIVGPIGTYFLTLNSVFKGNSTWAGATAAIMANVVLITYVIVAMKEDQSDKPAAEGKASKGQ